MSGGKNKILLVAGVFVLASAAGIAAATIPDGSGVIHGCYKIKGGELRIVDSPAEACSKQEAPLSWSQQGPKGDSGPQGLPGNANSMTFYTRSATGGAEEFTVVQCDAGDTATGGGIREPNINFTGGGTPQVNAPVDNEGQPPEEHGLATGWSGFIEGGSSGITVSVVCADTAP